MKTTVRVLPASRGEGRYFVRVDLPEKPLIPAQVEAVSQTTLSTELANGQDCVRTVEHLLAALAASGIDDSRIEIDGVEVPLMDGSAQIWVEAIAQAGITPSPISVISYQLPVISSSSPSPPSPLSPPSPHTLHPPVTFSLSNLS